MNKGGQEGPVGMSFGTIFAIILIIFILIVAIYVITKFLGVKSCTEFGLFKDDLQKAVDRAWNTGGLEGHSEPVNYTLPSQKITKICFVDVNYAGSGDANYKEFRKIFGSEKKRNVFFLPLSEACEDFKGIEIRHLNIAKILSGSTKGYQCLEVTKGKFNAIVKINLGDNLVTIIQT